MEPPRGFERIFENEFGVLFENASLPKVEREPGKAAVSLIGLLVLAGVGILITFLDIVLPGRLARVRLGIAAAAFIAASAALAPLAVTAFDELRHPPEVPAAQDEPGPGGAPPGVEPGGPGPGGARFPPDAPEGLREKYGRIQSAIPEALEAGYEPRMFWAPEDEMRFRELLESGKIDEADRLLDEAFLRLQAMIEDEPARPEESGSAPR